jgi:hypothetical protein
VPLVSVPVEFPFNDPAGRAEDPIELVLVGGPSDLPLTQRIRRVARLDREIKVEHRGGYEHFSPINGPQGGRPHWVVYEWRFRTAIAE